MCHWQNHMKTSFPDKQKQVTPLLFGAPAPYMFPLEFRGAVNHEETRVMGLLCSESCMTLTSAVFLTDPYV